MAKGRSFISLLLCCITLIYLSEVKAENISVPVTQAKVFQNDSEAFVVLSNGEKVKKAPEVKETVTVSLKSEKKENLLNGNNGHSSRVVIKPSKTEGIGENGFELKDNGDGTYKVIEDRKADSSQEEVFNEKENKHKNFWQSFIKKVKSFF